MPRKKLIYTDEHPYHIMARSNNREWFFTSMDTSWEIFQAGLKKAQSKFKFEVHLFVLMSNHYHLIASCSKEHPLFEVMAWLQKYISRAMNSKAGRINHVFGGPYKACLIRHPEHFSVIYKYVARNPVTAHITTRVENYKYSTLRTPSHRNEWHAELPDDYTALLAYLNNPLQPEIYETVRGQLQKTQFAPRDRNTRDPILHLDASLNQK